MTWNIFPSASPGLFSLSRGTVRALLAEKLNLAISRIKGPTGSSFEGEEMGLDINRAREVHFARMQKVLEEGLTNINLARNPEEADAARLRAQSRLEELNQMFEDAFPQEDIEQPV